MNGPRRKVSKPIVLDDLKPSAVTDAYWLEADRKTGDYPAHTDRSGKWLIFVPVVAIDEVWAGIKDATERGLLGGRSKVATARPNRNATNPNTKVICVYTYDSNDEKDVMRVRGELRKLGFTAQIYYKTDEDTYAGKYSKRGNKGISKYRA